MRSPAAAVSSKFRPSCHENSVHPGREVPAHCSVVTGLMTLSGLYSGNGEGPSGWPCGRNVYIIQVTLMPRRPRRALEDAKAAVLRAAGALHPHPETVQDAAFQAHVFFDRRDRVQVKYEMLRRHRVDGRPVTEVATAFGVSRQAFYQVGRGFAAGGLPGLVPRKRGPQGGHKCTDAVLDFVARRRATGAARGAPEVQAITRRFGVTIHPRSLDRALARREKKRRTPGTLR